MSCAIFRTGLRAPHMVLAGALVPAGTVLVTPDLDGLSVTNPWATWRSDLADKEKNNANLSHAR